MKLIDADKLETDTEWNDYDDDFVSYSQSQINNAEEVVPPVAIIDYRAIKMLLIDYIKMDLTDQRYEETYQCLKVFSKYFKKAQEELREEMGEDYDFDDKSSETVNIGTELSIQHDIVQLLQRQ